jgi:predicted aldo/keto reductase-like oxidoreductase
MLQGKNGALTYLRKAKEKGLARFIGFSAHPSRIDEQRAFIENADLDVTQLFINYVSRAQHHIEEKVVEFARQHNKGVVAMKVLGGDGQMADDYDRAFRYALSVPGVHCALIGASSPQEVKRAVQAAKDFKPMTAAEMKETIALGRKLYESGAKKVALLNRHLPHDLGAVSRA